MKRNLSILLMLMLLISASALPAFGEADSLKCGDYTYTLKPDGTALITSYLGQDLDLEVPAVLDEHAVSEIGYMAFTYVSCPLTITLPEGILHIGAYAFAGCTETTSILLPESLLSIDEGAFAGCSALFPLYLPPSLVTIGNNPFHDAENIYLVVAPDSFAENWAKEMNIPYEYVVTEPNAG